MGDCTAQDVSEIKKLVLQHPLCNIPDFTKPPWNETILVTPQNTVHSAWNSAMLLSHCQQTGQTLYILYANDSCHGQPLTRS